MIWTGRRLTLWNGTDAGSAARIRADGVRTRLHDGATDFGPGFYTTTNRAQAETWARKLAARRTAQPVARSGGPALLAWTIAWNDLVREDILAFARGDAEAAQFWDLIDHYRAPGNLNPHRAEGWFTAVIGPVMRGSPRLRQVEPGYDQVSFHGPRGEALLRGHTPAEFVL